MRLGVGWVGVGWTRRRCVPALACFCSCTVPSAGTTAASACDRGRVQLPKHARGAMAPSRGMLSGVREGEGGERQEAKVDAGFGPPSTEPCLGKAGRGRRRAHQAAGKAGRQARRALLRGAAPEHVQHKGRHCCLQVHGRPAALAQAAQRGWRRRNPAWTKGGETGGSAWAGGTRLVTRGRLQPGTARRCTPPVC